MNKELKSVLLEVKDLRTYFFTRHGVVKAVDGVSYNLAEGEMLGIVGESGSGKSVGALSILRLISLAKGKIMGGEVIFDGEDLLKLNEEEMRHIRGNKIAMVFQEPMTALNPVLTIGRQISESMQVHLGMDNRAATLRSAELLDMVGIPDAETKLDNYPHEFSGGMRQRVMISMALSCNPKILIADEPTSALDVTTQAQILELLKRLMTEFGVAVILITHSLGVVARYVDWVMVMYAGRIVESAPVRELYANPGHPYTLGLLKSVPRLDEIIKEKLVPIDGLPPNLVNLPSGCAFASRCSYVVNECHETTPELVPVAENHSVACWVDTRKNNGQNHG